jgi:hypothetical protein
MASGALLAGQELRQRSHAATAPRIGTVVAFCTRFSPSGLRCVRAGTRGPLLRKRASGLGSRDKAGSDYPVGLKPQACSTIAIGHFGATAHCRDRARPPGARSGSPVRACCLHLAWPVWRSRRRCQCSAPRPLGRLTLENGFACTILSTKGKLTWRHQPSE